MSHGAQILLQGIHKVYGTRLSRVHALRDVDMRIQAGEFVAIMGPSGSGKSTCMNILGCLDRPSAGTYHFEGLSVEQFSRRQRALLRRHRLGFVFQGFNLLQRTSAVENVELPLVYGNLPAKQRRRRALEALDALGLLAWRHHSPGELSGGQQQRVAIARALVTRPRILLADEPTGNLDSERSREIMKLLVEVNRRDGLTVIMVTHDPRMAEYADRQIHFLDGRIHSDEEKGP